MASTVSSQPQGFIAPKRSATHSANLPLQTHWSYVKARNGMVMTEPVVGFYFNPPVDAKCRWSTDNGLRQPQHLTFGSQLPQRVLVLWDDDKLDGEAAYYRQKYWEDMKTLKAPQRFEDLYEYFDGFTIWMHGATNLWNLMNLLAADAHTNWQEHERRVATECNDWVLDWLENFPSAQFNRDSLIRWNQKTDILTAVLTHYDWMNDLKDLDMVGQNIMRECLLFHYERLTGKKPQVACFNHRANDPPSVPSPAPDPVIAFTDVPPTNLPKGQPDLKIETPPPQVLDTIPEHASPTKTSTKANGLTIDTIATAKIPKHTVSAPATAVPQITCTPQVPGKAEGALVQTDGGDSTNDEFFNPQALATQIEIKARQLSAQSAPEEDRDSMLSAGRHNSQPRAASVTLQPAVLQKKDAVPRDMVPREHNVPTSATKTGHNTNKLPSRPSRKSPPRGPISRRNAVANVPTYHVSQHPMAQQGPPMGPPPPHQQLMPPYGSHNGMQQQPPAGFIPPTPPHGMPPHPNAFTSQGPPPPGTGIPPMGPPGVPFQNQFTMPQPRMDMPQFNNTQGHPMNTPPQYTTQQNVAVPIYQPNGYIAQSQNKPGPPNGNRQNSRRGSTNSIASRKLRDDPLHGPVYAMNPRKNSNASSGRSQRKLSSANPEQRMPQGSRTQCVNTQQYQQPGSAFEQLYDECACPRCAEASRSVFVKHDTLSLGENGVRDVLMRYFAAWSPTCVKTLPHNRAALVTFHTDHDAVSAIQSFWSGGEKHTIPGLSKNTSIWYPLYSRHYNPMTQKPTGAPRGLVEAHNTSRRLSGSSMQRRGSNPYLGQRPVFNNPSFGSGAPGLQQLQLQLLHEQPQQQMAGQPSVNNPQPGPMYAVPYQPQPPQASQRALWVPPANESRRKSSTTVSPKGEKAVSPKTCPEGSAPEHLREDWRSKPPSEEAIEDSSDEVAVADNASNVSSQGARSITIRLPNENGSVRSRSVSPETEDRPTREEVSETSPKVQAGPQEELKVDDTPTTVEAEPAKEVNEKSSPDSNKATIELAVPIQESQPVVAPEPAEATKKEGRETASNYSKVMSELTGPTETIDINTVIRHKPQKPRAPLPVEWDNEADGGSRSELQSRFTDLQDEFQADMQQEKSAAAPQNQEMEGAATAPEAPREPAPSGEPRDNQPKKRKGGKSKKKQAQVTALDAPASVSSSNTPTDGQSRVPSRASTSRPASRASIKRSQSATSTTAEPASRPSSAMHVHQEDQASAAGDGAAQPKKKKSNSKAQRKRKQALTVEPSAVSEGLAKTGGSQEQDQDQVKGRASSEQESPKKKPKTMHPVPEPEPEPVKEPSASEAATKKTTADDSQQKNIDEQEASSKDAGYRANAGGSLRMKKNRSPTKPQQQSNQEEAEKTPTKQESKPLQTIFEPPSEEGRQYVSPDANLFPNQKFAIDQARASAPPKMNLVPKKQSTTLKLAANGARIGSLPPGFNPYPQLPPNSKPSAWSAVVKRGIGIGISSDDPFSTGRQDEDQSKNWMNDKTVRSPQKPCGGGVAADTSPTPSPERKPGRRQGGGKGRSQLNAAAKAFTPLSSPTKTVASLRTAAAAETGATSAFSAPVVVQPVAAPGLDDSQPIPHHHVKKPSLPGRKGSGADARLVTPAGQTLDSAKVEQPGPPTKEKKKRAGGSSQAQQKPAPGHVATAAASGDSPALSNQKDFPTLAAAAAAPKKRRAASFAQAASGSAAPATTASSSAPASTSTSEKKKEEDSIKPTSPVAPAASPPNASSLGQRGAVSGPGDVPGAPAKKMEHEMSDKDDWTTVGPSKKTAGGKNTAAGRAASGRGGKAPQQHGSRGVSGRVPVVGEERKGG